MRPVLLGAALLLLLPFAASAPYVVTERCAYENSGSVGIAAGTTVVPGPFYATPGGAECVGPNGLETSTLTKTGTLMFLPEQPLDNCPPTPGAAIGGITGKYCGPMVPTGATVGCRATVTPFVSPSYLQGLLILLEAVPDVDTPDVGQALPSVGGGVLVREVDPEAAAYQGSFMGMGWMHSNTAATNHLPVEARVVAYPLTLGHMPPATIRVSCLVV